MMGENSLTFIPFDDPPKKVLYLINIYDKYHICQVFEEVAEHGFDGSDVTKVKGQLTI